MYVLWKNNENTVAVISNTIQPKAIQYSGDFTLCPGDTILFVYTDLVNFSLLTHSGLTLQLFKVVETRNLQLIF